MRRASVVAAALGVLALAIALASPIIESLNPADDPARREPGRASPTFTRSTLDPFALDRCFRQDVSDVDPLPARAGQRRLVRAIAAKVEEVRELRFEEPVRPRFLDPEQTSQRIGTLVEESYPAAEAASDQAILGALRAVPPTEDLKVTVKRALQSQVAGFYVPDTKELVVRTSGMPNAVDRITLAHELEHALADQVFELPLDDDEPAERADRSLARLALIEGDATLTMQRFAIATLDVREQLELAEDPEVAAAAAQGLDGVPHFVRRQLLFPYTDGLGYVCALYLAGGWRRVDATYADPPATTTEVLFPGRSFQARDLPDPRLAGWRHAYVTGFGAAPLMWLFEAPGGRPADRLVDPLGRVRWVRAGEAHLLRRGGRRAVVLTVATARDAAGMCSSLEDLIAATWPVRRDLATTAPGPQVRADVLIDSVVLTCGDEVATLAIAPDLATAEALAASL